ncbi:MAG TPA: hypothetical protein GXX40_07470 [Firmicutes bacterium]|nr:hypothetical protein [Bacillota bacterium]
MKRVIQLTMAVLVATLLLAPAQEVWAAPGLVDVESDIDIAGETATVRMDYRVMIDKPDVKAVPLTSLHMGGATLSDIRAHDPNGNPLEVSVKDAGLATDVTVAVPQGFKAGDKLDFVIEYRVNGAAQLTKQGEVPVHVPLLTLKWGPLNPVPGVFKGTVRLPNGWHYVEGFPSEPTKVDLANGRTTVTYSMQVMPSMIRAIITQGVSPFFNLERSLDAIAIASLIVIAYVAYYLIVKLPLKQAASQASK